MSEATFSWYMVDTSGTSYIDFGTPDASIIGDGSNILWLSVQSSSAWWQNTLTGLKWGENATTPGQTVTFTSLSAITDTGSSCIVGPKDYVDLINNEIISKLSQVSPNDSWVNIFFCSEKSKLPKFSLNFGGYWFEITPDDYVVVVSVNSDTICSLCIQSVAGYN